MDLFKNFIKNYYSDLNRICENIERNSFEKLYFKIKNFKKKKSNKVLIFGNGAGASIASHVANDMSNTLKIKTLSFDSATQLTCYSNDYGYENWVVKVLEVFFEKGDLIIFLSASGMSKNMINAAKHCKKKKIDFFSITGFKKENKLNKNSKNHIWINSKSYNKVELIQLSVLLIIIDRLNK
tara:strand:+ start:438 stop:983 length:546 start_codon:yes stop_codon:yes gene_type:complete